MCIFPVDVVELVKSQVCCSSRKTTMYPLNHASVRTEVRVVGAPLVRLRLVGAPPSCWEGVPSRSPRSLRVCALDRTRPSATISAGCFCLRGGDWASPHGDQRVGSPGSPTRSPLLADQVSCVSQGQGSSLPRALWFVFFFPKLVYF